MIQSEAATRIALEATAKAKRKAVEADSLALLRRLDRYLDRTQGVNIRLDLRAAIKRAAQAER